MTRKLPVFVENSDGWTVTGIVELLEDQWWGVVAERIRAHHKHDGSDGDSMERKDFDDEAWLRVLVEEVGEVAEALNDHRHGTIVGRTTLAGALRTELVQLLAMASAWVDAIDMDEMREE